MSGRLRIVKLRVVLAVLAGVLALASPADADQDGFLPSSTSWLTARQGAVFGYVPCGRGLCPRLLVTTNGGESWQQVEAPPVKLPDNHNQVKLTVVDSRNAFVSDGDILWAPNEKTKTWYPVTLAGLRAPLYISKVAVFHSRVFVVASQLGNGEADFTQIYAGSVGARILRPIPGLVATGGTTYGDIAVEGGIIQAYLGADFSTEHYGYSVNGVHFVEAPAPCPVANFAILGGIRDGSPTALCNGSGGSPGPGHMTRQVWSAPRPGAEFAPTNPAPSLGITQGFGPASPRNMTIAAVGGGTGILHSSSNAGKSWETTELSERGFGLFDLHFVTERLGFVVDGIPDAGSAIYRTTDAGRTWKELTVTQ